MSKKPLKKSDLGKSWLKSRSDNKKKMAPEYHLIVSEGTDTEPFYFEAIKNKINNNFKNRISLEVEGMGDNTLSLFRKAKMYADNSANVYKHVWIVYDKDDFPATHFDQTAKMCEESSNNETTYHALWSNQCIELWFLLHFSFLQADLHRSEYWPKLTECLKSIGAGDYKKNRDDMFDLLYPYIDSAISNAKKLDEINDGKKPSESAPGTKVYHIIEHLRNYL